MPAKTSALADRAVAVLTKAGRWMTAQELRKRLRCRQGEGAVRTALIDPRIETRWVKAHHREYRVRSSDG